MIVLEELEHAQARGAKIYAELLGYGVSSDATHVSDPDPTGGSPARALQMAFEDAGDRARRGRLHQRARHLDAGRRQRRDARDQARARRGEGVSRRRSPRRRARPATASARRARSRRSFTILALERGVLPPTINQEVADPTCDLDYIPNEARREQVEIGVSNSFGFGGHNACVVFRRWHDWLNRRRELDPRPLSCR